MLRWKRTAEPGGVIATGMVLQQALRKLWKNMDGGKSLSQNSLQGLYRIIAAYESTGHTNQATQCAHLINKVQTHGEIEVWFED